MFNSQIWEYFPDFRTIPSSDLDTWLTDSKSGEHNGRLLKVGTSVAHYLTLGWLEIFQCIQGTLLNQLKPAPEQLMILIELYLVVHTEYLDNIAVEGPFILQVVLIPIVFTI